MLAKATRPMPGILEAELGLRTILRIQSASRGFRRLSYHGGGIVVSKVMFSSGWEYSVWS